jgi:hypothetical protein
VKRSIAKSPPAEWAKKFYPYETQTHIGLHGGEASLFQAAHGACAGSDGGISLAAFIDMDAAEVVSARREDGAVCEMAIKKENK